MMMRIAAKMPSFTPARPEEILKPAKPWFVVFTLAIAMLANTLPARPEEPSEAEAKGKGGRAKARRSG